MTSQTIPCFRKAKNGKWVVFGPTSQVRVGEITVAKRDGSQKTVTVESLGRPFDVDGVECVYGYIRSDRRQSSVSRVRRGGYCRSCERAKRGGYYKQHLFDGCDECGNERP